jgi:hypothetical protein
VDAVTQRTPEELRGRRVLILTTVASVVVMGGLVALALMGSDGGGAAQATPSPITHPPAHRAVTFPPGCTADPDRPPRLQVDLPPEGVEFGEVKQGAVVERVVHFTNAGLGPLCIADPDSGCSCAKATIRGDKRRYESGEGGEFVITLRTEGHSGKQDRTFSVSTNEIETPRHTYMVKAMISLGVVVDPNQMGFGNVRRNQPAKATVRLTSPAADAPWQITDVVGVKLPTEEAPVYTWEATPIVDPTRTKQGYTLVVTHPGSPTEVRMNGRVVVKTTHPDRPEIALPAFLTVLAPVAARPSVAIFGFLKPGTPLQPVPILLEPTADGVVFNVGDLRIEPAAGKTIGPDGPGFVATVGKNAKGMTTVNVSYDGKSRAPGLIEATLVVPLDLPEQKEIRIPLRATVGK